MSSDPLNPFSKPLPTPPPLPAGWQQPLSMTPLPLLASGGGLGSSLAQSARMKQIKSARLILLLVGGLHLVIGGILFGLSPTIAKSAIDDEIKASQRQGMVVDPAKVAEAQLLQERGIRLVSALILGVGALFTAFGFIVKMFPVPVTVTSLVIYVGLQIAGAIASPESLVQGWWLKLIIVIGLAKAVQAAIAYQKELNVQQDAFTGFSG